MKILLKIMKIKYKILFKAQKNLFQKRLKLNKV